MHAVVIAEGHLLVLNLHRHRNKNRVAGNPHEIEPVIERNLIAQDARADHFFQILELDRRRRLHFRELLQAGEFVLAVEPGVAIHLVHPERRGGTVRSREARGLAWTCPSASSMLGPPPGTCAMASFSPGSMVM